MKRTIWAMETQSADEAASWRQLTAAWDEANESLVVNDSVPHDLPQSGHVFALLGLVLNDDGTMRPELISRLEVAKASLDAHPASRVIVSGAQERNGWTEAARMRDWLVEHGVDEARIIVEDTAANTQDNALRSLDLMYADGDITSYTVISSASHIRRASLLFHAASLKRQGDLGAPTFIEPRSNVAFMDTTTSEQPPSAAETRLIAANMADLFGVTSIYDSLVATPPPVPDLSATYAPAQSPGEIRQIEVRAVTASRSSRSRVRQLPPRARPRRPG